MKIKRAKHYGFCFGVREAIASVESLAESGQVTVLGELVHNPAVAKKLQEKGVRIQRGGVVTGGEGLHVITAHGVSDAQRAEWKKQGIRLHDTTCPLVRRAHEQLRKLVSQGFYPVVIGQIGHVEVKGLIGNFRRASVLSRRESIAELPLEVPLGIVAQTTQPIHLVRNLVAEIKRSRPLQEIRFIDTVCQPTKERQGALEELCREVGLVIVVGGRHSNNTRQLVQTAVDCGCLAFQVESVEDLREEWFHRIELVGLTAGTSTPDETLDAVETQIFSWAEQKALIEELQNR